MQSIEMVIRVQQSVDAVVGQVMMSVVVVPVMFVFGSQGRALERQLCSLLPQIDFCYPATATAKVEWAHEGKPCRNAVSLGVCFRPPPLIPARDPLFPLMGLAVLCLGSASSVSPLAVGKTKRLGTELRYRRTKLETRTTHRRARSAVNGTVILEPEEYEGKGKDGRDPGFRA